MTMLRCGALKDDSRSYLITNGVIGELGILALGVLWSWRGLVCCFDRFDCNLIVVGTML